MKAAMKKSAASKGASSVPGLCLGAVLAHNKSDALNYRADGKWFNIAAETFVERVKNCALGLAALGVRPGDRIALLSENRPEWSIVDLGILSLGAINVPIYTTQAVEQVRYILEDSGARAIFVSGRRVFKHARPGIEGVANLENLIFFDADAADLVEGAITLEALEARGREREQAEPYAFDALSTPGRGDELATIIYTSGTTGEPKGVMLTHDNFISNVLSIAKTLPIS